MQTNRKILIVDDNRDIHNDFRKVLCGDHGSDHELDALEADLFGNVTERPEAADRPGIVIESAFQGEEGIEMALRAARSGEPYAMAFVDVRMPPGIDGIQTIKRLWQHLPDLQCVICTAFSDYDWEQINAELKRSGNLLILKKPFDSIEALQITHSLTEKAELARRNVRYQDQLEEKVRRLTCIERQLLEKTEQLEQARYAAESASRAKSDFLANVSHELRTPLNGVIGMADLLLHTELTERQNKFARTIKSSSLLLLELLNELLDFSKIEAGKLELEHLEFDLLDTIESMIDVISHRCREKGLELAAYIDPRARRRLRGDAGRVRQILMNLANNAVKFTSEGEVVIQATVGEETAEQLTIHFTVADTGIGIPESCRDRLFQVFTQADSSTTRKYGGTGLGLAISKQLCEMMGGKIGFESEYGKGSTFWFTLALEKAAALPAQRRMAEKVKGIRVLVVDDNQASRTILQKQLRSWGFETDTAEGGHAALDMFRAAERERAPYRIALVDLEMPGMKGERLREIVRAEPELRDTHLILLSPLDAAVDLERMRSHGFTDCITKPVMQSDLLNALMRATSAVDLDGIAVEWNVQRFTPELKALPGAKRRQARILVAEDNRVNQEVAVEILRSSGYQCDVVPNGREAVERLSSDEYDLVLMDMQMPEMDGVEATRRIRQTSASAASRAGSIPIIALTANAMAKDRQRCLEAGMNDYLSKPLNPLELLTKIENLLEESLQASAAAPADGAPAGACQTLAEPEEPPRIEAVPPVDRDSLVRRCMGNQAFAERLLQNLLSDLPDQLEQLAAAVKHQDWESAARLAHDLKGSAGNASAVSLHEAAKRLEELAKACEAQLIPAQLTVVQGEYSRLQEHLTPASLAT